MIRDVQKITINLRIDFLKKNHGLCTYLLERVDLVECNFCFSQKDVVDVFRLEVGEIWWEKKYIICEAVSGKPFHKKKQPELLELKFIFFWWPRCVELNAWKHLPAGNGIQHIWKGALTLWICSFFIRHSSLRASLQKKICHVGM